MVAGIVWTEPLVRHHVSVLFASQPETACGSAVVQGFKDAVVFFLAADGGKATNVSAERVVVVHVERIVPIFPRVNDLEEGDVFVLAVAEAARADGVSVCFLGATEQQEENGREEERQERALNDFGPRHVLCLRSRAAT